MSRRALIAVAAALAVGGCGASHQEADEPVAPPPPAARPERPRGADGDRHGDATAARRASAPVRIEIPSIRVDAPLIGLGLDAHRALEVPKRFDVAGWWTGGSRPGERGPAVIAGHVDSKTGPAVFYELGELRRGAAVIVRRRDGTSVRFIVQGSERYAKDHFPTARVYGPTRRPGAAADHLLRAVRSLDAGTTSTTRWSSRARERDSGSSDRPPRIAGRSGGPDDRMATTPIRGASMTLRHIRRAAWLVAAGLAVTAAPAGATEGPPGAGPQMPEPLQPVTIQPAPPPGADRALRPRVMQARVVPRRVGPGAAACCGSRWPRRAGWRS